MMDKRIVFAGMVLFVVLFFAVFTLLFVFDETAEPKTYVGSYVGERQQNFFFDKKIDRFPARVEIVPLKIENKTVNVGVSTDSDILDFGRVIENMSVRKFFNIRNDDRKLKVCVRAYGGLASMVDFPEDSFVMETGAAREVGIIFQAGPIGNYSGEVDVITKKPRYEFMDFLLPYVAC